MTKPKNMLGEEQVAEYLKLHPEFFEKHPELFEELGTPSVDHGGNVVDLRQHMVGKLQTGIKSLKSKYEGLLTSSRDNMSTLHQVHEAALALIRAPGLEQLLERIIIDLPALFGVDIVRLGIESEAGEFYESKFGEQNASGVAFFEQGLIDKVLGRDKSILLAADTTKQFINGFETIFADCSGDYRILRAAAYAPAGDPARCIIGFWRTHQRPFP